MENITHTTRLKKLINALLSSLLIFTTTTLFSQNYRNVKAYIDDFGKNELYIKKAINDYSQTIVEAQESSRTYTTKETIIYKLNNINTILNKNDKGFEGNTLLRDSFLKMSQKTVQSLTNGSLTLNDYKVISVLSIAEIEKKLNFKETNLNGYYAEVIAYENSKNEFGKSFNIAIRHIVDNNILEYNAKENFVFYKVNVADEKFINAVNENNIDEAKMSLDYLKKVCKETNIKVNLIGQCVNDKSLNKANLNVIETMIELNNNLFAYYIQFNKMHTSLENLKIQAHNNPKSLTTNEYRDFIKKYNAVNKIYNDTYQSIQSNKKLVLDKWYATNSAFLKRNMQYEDYRLSFAQEE